MSNAPYVSVVIRCRNEGKALREVLSALAHQECQFDWEVVLVDNESSDDTVQVAEQFGARIITIKRGEFTYGRAINRGIAAARGEIIFLLSAHSLPLTAQFLSSAVKPFSDPKIAAVRCMMATNVDQLRRWYAPVDIGYATPEDQQAAESSYSWAARYPTAGCCLLRRSVWEEVTFDETLECNEDKAWASAVLRQGYKLRFCADALWLYVRRRTPGEMRDRMHREELSFYRMTGRARIGWAEYFYCVLRTLLMAPVSAATQAWDALVRDTQSVLVPWLAQKPPIEGSFAEFDRMAKPAAPAGDLQQGRTDRQAATDGNGEAPDAKLGASAEKEIAVAEQGQSEEGNQPGSSSAGSQSPRIPR